MEPLEWISQIASAVGACLILIGYFGLQSGRLKESSDFYLAFNFIGAMLLLIAAVITRQAGFILLEGMWMTVTAFGWFKQKVKTDLISKR